MENISNNLKRGKKSYSPKELFGEGNSVHNLAGKIINQAKNNKNSATLLDLEETKKVILEIMAKPEENQDLSNFIIRMAKSDPSQLFD